MRREYVLLIYTLLFAACGVVMSPDRVDSGNFTAAVRGAIDVDYVGTGAFSFGRDLRSPAIAVLTVRSEGAGPSQGEELVLYGGVHIGDVGRYVLEAASDTLQASRFSAYYVRRVGETYEAYSAVSGEVDITRSTRERIEGTVSFAALLYCSSPLQGPGAPVGSCDPRILSPDAPSIAVTGSFEAVPDVEELTR